MAKINSKRTVAEKLQTHKDATVNEEGGLAFKQSPKSRLFQLVLTSMFNEPKHYGKTDKKILSTVKEVAVDDPEFVLKLAVYARNYMFLRTIPQVLLTECAYMEEYKGTDLITRYAPLVIRRADEVMEVLAYSIKVHGKPIPNGLRRGVAKAFRNFDEYQLSKYNRKGEVTLKDAIRIVHPKPENDERSDLYKRAIADELKTPETWETILSDWKGKGFADKGKAWESIIDMWTKDGKVRNYMAILRNLRNILDNVKSPEHVAKIVAAVKNPQAVKYSKQLPFRFYSAYRELEGNTNMKTSGMLDALQEALDLSVENLPTFGGSTLMSADNSGSMHQHASAKSSIMMADVANLLQAMADKLCIDNLTTVFGEDFAVVNTSSRDGVITNMQKFKRKDVGHSTNGWKVFDYMMRNNLKVDRVLIFTDMEMYNDGWYSTASFSEYYEKYRASVNPNVKLYLFNLNSYGTSVVPDDAKGVVKIAGWSDKVLKFIELYEKDKTTMVDEIEAITA